MIPEAWHNNLCQAFSNIHIYCGRNPALALGKKKLSLSAGL